MRPFTMVALGLGLSYSGFMLSSICFVFAQNATGTTTEPATSTFIETLSAIGILIGAIGTFLGTLGFKRTDTIGKYAQTFGNKIVDIAHDHKRTVNAIDIMAGGKIEEALKVIQKQMTIVKERAIAASEQLQYLNNHDKPPNDPDKDPDMPREDPQNDNQEGRKSADVALPS